MIDHLFCYYNAHTLHDMHNLWDNKYADSLRMTV